jgi:hypothetical protein
LRSLIYVANFELRSHCRFEGSRFEGRRGAWLNTVNFCFSAGLAAPQGATFFTPLDNTGVTSSLTIQLAQSFVRYLEMIHILVPAYDRLTTWGIVSETESKNISIRRQRSSAIEHIYHRPHVPGPSC